MSAAMNARKVLFCELMRFPLAERRPESGLEENWHICQLFGSFQSGTVPKTEPQILQELAAA
jgi:hypothetical protein